MEHNDNKQVMWELWFVVSVVLFIGMIIIGTIPNSKFLYLDWPIYMFICSANLVISVYYGVKK